MTSLVVRRVRSGGLLKLKLVRVERKATSNGVLKLERVQVICPACGQQVEAIATDGRVKGYCTVAKQDVDFPVDRRRVCKHITAETRDKMSAGHRGRHPTAEPRAKISAGLVRWHNKKRGSKLNNLPQGATF